MTRGQKLVGIGAVHGLSLALAVGGVWATVGQFILCTDAFVRRNTAPSEGFHDVGFGTGHKARLVRILDAKQEITPVLLSKQVVV